MYNRENVPIFEAIYGPGMISLGGIEAVRRMLSGVDLSDKNVLDIGSGIGGLAHWVAENYSATVIGFDIHPWMAEYASTQSNPDTLGKCEFLTYDGQSIHLADHSVDIFLSKGVLTNIEDKKPLLVEISRLARGGAQIILIDWLSPDDVGPISEELPLGDKSRKETRESYRQLFKEAGLGKPIFHDLSEEYLRYVEDIGRLLRSDEHKRKFDRIISDELRSDLLKSNDHLEERIRSRSQLSMKIISTVP